MPRKPEGETALTPAQKMARLRERKAMTLEAWRQALERIRTIKTAREAREIADAALNTKT